MTSLEDIIDDIDALRAENNNEKAYYNGKAYGYREAQEALDEAHTLEAFKTALNDLRKQLRTDKQDLNYNECADEENRRFISGELDAIDEVRDIIYDKEKK